MSDAHTIRVGDSYCVYDCITTDLLFIENIGYNAAPVVHRLVYTSRKFRQMREHTDIDYLRIFSFRAVTR
jgi:hypothetical protein